MSRLTSDNALIVLLAFMAVVLISLSVILGYGVIPTVNSNEDQILKVCSALDIQNDLLTNKFLESNKVLVQRNNPLDARLQTLNEVALNDLKDAAEILKEICN